MLGRFDAGNSRHESKVNAYLCWVVHLAQVERLCGPIGRDVLSIAYNEEDRRGRALFSRIC